MFNILEINMATFCTEASSILKIAGWVLTIFKIAIPILVIVYGIFDLGKSVTAAKPEEINKSLKSLLYRAIAGIVIFFIPTVVMFVFEQVTDFTTLEQQEGYSVCEACILKPWSRDCN